MNKHYVTKIELRDLVFEKVQTMEEGICLSRENVWIVITAFFEVLLDIIRNNDKLTVFKMFSLKRKWVKSRKYNNFGDPIVYPGHWEVDFKPGSLMQRACSDSAQEAYSKTKRNTSFIGENKQNMGDILYKIEELKEDKKNYISYAENLRKTEKNYSKEDSRIQRLEEEIFKTVDKIVSIDEQLAKYKKELDDGLYFQ